MKTKEEIEQLAFKSYGDGFLKGSFIHGYTQCQEDMADKETQDKIKEHILNHANNQSPEDRLETELAAKKYTEEDLREAFKQSRLAKVFEEGMPPVWESFEDYIKSLNKQNNDQ